LFQPFGADSCGLSFRCPGLLTWNDLAIDRGCVVAVACEAAQRTGQLDPGRKPILAHTIHHALIARIKEALKSSRGIIAEPGSFYDPRPNASALESGLSSSMLTLG
jgi:hypothetical protein